jgi:hypothetical protein
MEPKIFAPVDLFSPKMYYKIHSFIWHVIPKNRKGSVSIHSFRFASQPAGANIQNRAQEGTNQVVGDCGHGVFFFFLSFSWEAQVRLHVLRHWHTRVLSSASSRERHTQSRSTSPDTPKRVYRRQLTFDLVRCMTQGHSLPLQTPYPSNCKQGTVLASPNTYYMF